MQFYTIMTGNKFLNANLFRRDSENIVEAVKFTYKEDVEEYFEGLRKDRGFRIVKVKCELEDVEV